MAINHSLRITRNSVNPLALGSLGELFAIEAKPAVGQLEPSRSEAQSPSDAAKGVSKAVPSQRRAAQRQSLEEARTYVMAYDKVQKKLVVNETSDRFVHDIWQGSDTKPGA